MNKWVILILLFSSINAFCQNWYSKFFDPFDGGQEAAFAVVLDQDSVWVRANTVCPSGDKLCTFLGRYDPEKENFEEINHYEDIQGGHSLLVFPNKFVLSAEERILNEYIGLNVVKKPSLDFDYSLDLKIEDSRYFSYTIKNSIKYMDKSVIGAQVLDSMNFIPYQGWYNYQENAVFFVLNSDLQTDTILIIPPSSGAFLKIADMVVGPDSILYISFYEYYLKPGSSQDYLEDRYVVYGFDKSYQKVFQWIGPDFDNPESLPCIAIDHDTTLYINDKFYYRTYLKAINPDGSIKWELLFDSTFGENLYNINQLIVAENGDIVGAGQISSVIDELGAIGFLFRIDANGKLKWKRAIRINKGLDFTVPDIFPLNSELTDLIELPGGDLLATGWVRKYIGENNPDGPYDFDIWMLKTSSDGCLWNDCPYIQDIVTKPEYFKIVTSANEWVVDHHSESFPSEIYRFTFSIDSINLDGKYYHELIYSRNMSSGPWESTSSYFREEKSKVYSFDLNSDPVQRLIYDFDFGIGDTLRSNSQSENCHKEIVQVGTMKLNDSIPRKFLVLECTSQSADSTSISFDSTTWIEGMGDITRLFWTNSICDSNTAAIDSLRCFSTNGQLLYLRPGLEGCYTTSIYDLETEPFNVYPNPNFGVMYFDNSESSIQRILMYDNLGKVALSSNTMLTENQLDISILPSGFYHGLVYFTNNTIKSFRIVLEK